MSYPLFQTALLGEGLEWCSQSVWGGDRSGEIFRRSSGVQSKLWCLSGSRTSQASEVFLGLALLHFDCLRFDRSCAHWLHLVCGGCFLQLHCSQTGFVIIHPLLCLLYVVSLHRAHAHCWSRRLPAGAGRARPVRVWGWYWPSGGHALFTIGEMKPFHFHLGGLQRKMSEREYHLCIHKSLITSYKYLSQMFALLPIMPI